MNTENKVEVDGAGGSPGSSGRDIEIMQLCSKMVVLHYGTWP